MTSHFYAPTLSQPPRSKSVLFRPSADDDDDDDEERDDDDEAAADRKRKSKKKKKQAADAEGGATAVPADPDQGRNNTHAHRRFRTTNLSWQCLPVQYVC